MADDDAVRFGTAAQFVVATLTAMNIERRPGNEEFHRLIEEADPVLIRDAYVGLVGMVLMLCDSLAGLQGVPPADYTAGLLRTIGLAGARFARGGDG